MAASCGVGSAYCGTRQASPAPPADRFTGWRSTGAAASSGGAIGPHRDQFWIGALVGDPLEEVVELLVGEGIGGAGLERRVVDDERPAAQAVEDGAPGIALLLDADRPRRIGEPVL